MVIVDPRVDPKLVPEGSRAIVIAEHQEQYLDLPSIRTPLVRDADGSIKSLPCVITRWQFTEEERAAILRGEDLYITILSAGSINPLFATIGPVDWNEVK